MKYLMQKTQQEAGWDMDNDSDLKGGSGKYHLHSRFYVSFMISLILHFHELELHYFNQN